MRKIIVYSIIAITLVSIFVFFILYNKEEAIKSNSIDNKEAIKITSIDNNYYKNALTQIEAGNEWIKANNWSDTCTSSYRYFHRGCYYSRVYPDGIVGGNLSGLNLTHDQIWELCGNFIFPGQVAYCYNINSQNDLERQECLNFAGNDKYLQRVCKLKDGELIPSASWGPYPGETAYKVDSQTFIEPKGYPYIPEI